MLYMGYVDPFFSHHEHEIEEFVGRAHERVKDQGLRYFYKVVDFFLPGQQQRSGSSSSSSPRAPPAAASTGYVQSLLSRFNLPIASTTTAPAAGGGDYWWSGIGSSLSAMTSTTTREIPEEQVMPREMANLSRSDKMKYISSQRDLLGAIGSALTREEISLGEEDTASDGSAMDGNGAPLRKNRSDNSFTHVNVEDIAGSTTSSSTAKQQPPASPTMSRWTSGWFGRGQANASGAKPTDVQARARA